MIEAHAGAAPHDTQASRWATRAAHVFSAALTIAIAVYAAIVVHQFYLYIDHAVYLSVDDALANTAYALGTHGRYGFPTSPVLVGISRNNGIFNYGPWYFFLGGGLIWLFGYSLTLLRSIHIAAVIGAIVAARAWLSDGRPRTPEWALFAAGLLWTFDPGQWPMVRPDIMVSAFAIAFVLASGLAIERGSPKWWFVAGLCAGCAALTHLIAWALVPAAAIVWAVQASAARLYGLRTPARHVTALAALVAGGLVAVLMFYASFGFRVGDQLHFLQAYRTFTVGSLQDQGAPVAYLPLVQRHYSAAFGWFPRVVQRGLLGISAIAVALIVTALRRPTPISRDVLVRVAPPLVAWVCYLGSLGFYANFHSGYAMLNQFLALWVAAAVLRIVVRALPLSARRVAVASLSAVLLVSTAALARQKLNRPNYRLLHADTWVGIDRYVDEVLAPVPRGSTAWGTPLVGIENPDRIQLLQYADAVLYAPAIRPDQRAALAPEFLVWSYPENRGIPSDVATRQPTWPQSMASLFPAVRYEPAALVGADPYGVTRVYVRRPRDGGPSGASPTVAVFDSARHQWARSSGASTSDAFSPWPTPVQVETTRVAPPKWVAATHSYRAELAAGDYVVRIFVRTGTDPTTARMIVVSSAPSIEVTRTELAPPGDICAFGAGDSIVELLLLHHPGGAAYLGHFDSTEGAAVDRIETARVEPLTPSDVAVAAAATLAPGDWTVFREAGVSATPAGSDLAVRGNGSQYGYQAMSRLVDLPPGARVGLHLRVERTAGSVCVGVLDKTTQRWLVSADRLIADARFVADASGGAYIVVANCNADPGGNPPSVFTIHEAQIDVQSESGYSDRFMKAAIAAGAIRP